MTLMLFKCFINVGESGEMLGFVFMIHKPVWFCTSGNLPALQSAFFTDTFVPGKLL